MCEQLAQNDSVHAWPVRNTVSRAPILAIVIQVKYGISTHVTADQWRSRQYFNLFQCGRESTEGNG
jgi:hypothetical protein